MHTFEVDHLARLVELSDDLISVGGADGYFHRVSPSWTRTLGWDERTLLERPFASFIHPEDTVITTRQIRRVLRGRRLVRFASRFQHRDGTYRWLRWNVAPSPDSAFAYAIARDITEAQALRDHIEAQTALLRATEQRLATEVAHARDVQQAFLSTSPLVQSWVEVAGRCIASHEMSGDFLDWRELATGEVSVGVGDVMGKGVAAALLMATTHALLRSPDVLARASSEPARRLDWINASLAGYLGASGRFVTAFHATCDRDGVVRYVDAGHGLAAVRRSDGSIEALPGPGGLPLGIAPGSPYRAGEVFLWPGDVLVVATDGLRDVLGAVGHGDWLAHLRSAVSDWTSAGAITEDVVLWAESATLGAGAPDDLSVLVLVYRGDPLACSPAQYAITLDATPESLDRARRWATRRISAAGGDPDGARPFVLALHEVLANVIEHARPASLRVRLDVHRTPGGLSCEAAVEDDGATFVEPSGAPPSPDGGRGLAICRAALDEFAYHRSTGVNHWRLVSHVGMTLDGEREADRATAQGEDATMITGMTGRLSGGEIVVEEVAGRLDLATADTEQLRLRARAASAQRLILRLGGLEFIDSSGIGMLVVLQRDLQARGGSLLLAEAPAQARMALRLTRLDWLLPCFDTLEDALAA